MTDPSHAVLRECADQLRDLARTHRTSASQASALVDDCAKLEGTETWAGTYAEETDAQLNSWKHALADDAGKMRDDAASWVRTADDFDDKADKAEKAEKADSK